MANPIGEQFDLHVVGDETGETFTGKFRAKEKYSWEDQIAIDRYRRELLGPGASETTVDNYKRCSIIAELSRYITESPEWWRMSRGGLDLVDDNIAGKVYDEAVAIRTKYVEAQKARGEAAKKKLAEEQK